MGTDGYAFNVDPDGDPAAFMVEGLSGDWKSCDILRSEPQLCRRAIGRGLESTLGGPKNVSG